MRVENTCKIIFNFGISHLIFNIQLKYTTYVEYYMNVINANKFINTQHLNHMKMTHIKD
jgi:archaellum component FlaF (FlaF/FlaG flagellin family)